MKTILITEEEKNRIQNLYGLKSLILEDSIWGKLARFLGKAEASSADDIAKAFASTEKVLFNELDEIITTALKTKNLTAINDLEAKLMHIYNPSSLTDPKIIAQAQEKTAKFLNGYAKNKNFRNFGELKNQQISSQPNYGSAYQGTKINLNTAGRYGQKTMESFEKSIDFTQMSTIKNMDELNKTIARFLENPRYERLTILPRGGFEKLGIKPTDYNAKGFRGWIEDQIFNKRATINRANGQTGDWSINTQ